MSRPIRMLKVDKPRAVPSKTRDHIRTLQRDYSQNAVTEDCEIARHNFRMSL